MGSGTQEEGSKAARNAEEESPRILEFIGKNWLREKTKQNCGYSNSTAIYGKAVFPALVTVKTKRGKELDVKCHACSMSDASSQSWNPLLSKTEVYF